MKLQSGGIRGFFVDLYATSKWHIENHLIPTIYPIGGGEKSEVIASRIGIPALPAIIAYVTFVLVIIGYFRWIFREGLSAFSLFPLFYISVLIIWGWDDPRFLYPILPQLFLGLFLGIGAVLIGLSAIFTKAGANSILVNGALIAFVLIMVAVSMYKDLNPDDTRSHVGDLELRTEWIKDNTPQELIILTDAPEIDYVYSNRKTIRLYYDPISADAFIKDLRRDNVNYVLIAPPIYWQMHYSPSYSNNGLQKLSLLKQLSSERSVELVYASETSMVQVYKILP